MDTRRGILVNSRPDQYISTTVNSSGIARGSIGPCPEAYEWYVERLTCSQSGAAVAATALLEIYVLPTDLSSGTPDGSKQGRQDIAVGTDVANDVSDQFSAIVVPAGYYLVAYWTGLTSGDKVQLSSQVQVRKLELEASVRGRHAHTLDHRADDKPADVAAIVPADTVAAV